MTLPREVDVLVLGFGPAGAGAAIAAPEQGARVVIVEKMPAPGGNCLKLGRLPVRGQRTRRRGPSRRPVLRQDRSDRARRVRRRTGGAGALAGVARRPPQRGRHRVVRGHAPLLAALPRLVAPLYAIEFSPGVATASGGPRRDGLGRVMRRGGSPIPGLYAAGAAGAIWGHLTEHEGGLTDALVFEQIPGGQAASRERLVAPRPTPLGERLVAP